MNMAEINPKIIEDVKSAFEKIKIAPNFSFDIENVLCKYRGPNDTKCVIGHIIPDEEYEKSMEGDNVNNVSVYDSLCKVYGNVNETESAYLNRAQQYHDAIAIENKDELTPADTVFSYENFDETVLQKLAR